MKGLPETTLGPSSEHAGYRVAVVTTQWNTAVVSALSEACVATLKGLGVGTVLQHTVPGAYELPYAAATLLDSGSVDAVVCIGVLIKGETMHFEYISQAVSSALMDLQCRPGSAPVVFGVLTCLTEAQAMDRAGMTGAHNHGVDWGNAAVHMINLRRQLQQ